MMNFYKRIKKMKEVVCTEEKCLILGLCKANGMIRCSKLTLYHRLYYLGGNQRINRLVWFKINQTLPNLQYIRICNIDGTMYPGQHRPISAAEEQEACAKYYKEVYG